MSFHMVRLLLAVFPFLLCKPLVLKHCILWAINNQLFGREVTYVRSFEAVLADTLIATVYSIHYVVGSFRKFAIYPLSGLKYVSLNT